MKRAAVKPIAKEVSLRRTKKKYAEEIVMGRADRQADRQTDRQIDRQASKQTGKQTISCVYF